MCQVSGVKRQHRKDSGFASGADGECEFQSSDLKFQRRGGKKGRLRPKLKPGALSPLRLLIVEDGRWEIADGS